MPFVPLDDEKEKEGKPEAEDSKDEVEKARESAEIQKYETEKIELKRKAVFAENDIKDSEDLKDKITEVTEKEFKLNTDRIEFENKKAVEMSAINKQKAELDQKGVELDKREQMINEREKDIGARETLVAEREDLMTSIERQKLKEQEEYNSLTERLTRNYTPIISLMGKNANILIKAGFNRLGNGIWDEIEEMGRWKQNGGVEQYTDAMVVWLKGEVEDCNKKAVEMARLPKQYSQSSWDKIVDNLEEIYKILPELKPKHLPKNEE